MYKTKLEFFPIMKKEKKTNYLNMIIYVNIIGMLITKWHKWILTFDLVFINLLF